MLDSGGARVEVVKWFDTPGADPVQCRGSWVWLGRPCSSYTHLGVLLFGRRGRRVLGWTSHGKTITEC
jgi:hypothetical protein